MRESSDIFKTPIVDISELDKIITLIVASSILYSQKSNDSFQKALLCQDEALLDKCLILLARYVGRIADGNARVVLKSGFDTGTKVSVLTKFTVFDKTNTFVR